jgi:hypothetical protein
MLTNNNNNFDDLLDEIEYNYYLNILLNLKENNIIK